jgi:hypothetical protein
LTVDNESQSWRNSSLCLGSTMTSPNIQANREN